MFTLASFGVKRVTHYNCENGISVVKRRKIVGRYVCERLH